MSVELKLKALSEYIGFDEDDIRVEDDIVFITPDYDFYVLTEKERNGLAWDKLYKEHDFAWYSVDEVSELLDINKEELQLMFVPDMLLNDESVARVNGELQVQGRKINTLIEKIMNYPRFIDLYFEKFTKSNNVGIIITEGNKEEIIKNGFYIYQMD